tara:strand:+ start:908 stop:2644 length:1737 start_codon:yes stop_codon:yes gene_type:complete
MGKFEDDIKKKLDEGNIEYTPSSWDQMQKKLSEKPSYTEFEKRMQDTMAGGSIPVPPESWGSFSERNNIPNEFENALSDKINNGEVDLNENHWEDFSEKLNNSNLTAYERTVKETLNSKKISYNNSHWKALEKMLHGDRSKKIFWRSAAAILLLITTGIGVNQFSKTEKNTLINHAPAKNFDSTTNHPFNKKEPSALKQEINSSNLSLQSSDKRTFEKNPIENSNTLNENFESEKNYPLNTIVEDKSNEKLTLFPSIAVSVKNTFPSSFELINHQVNRKKNPVSSDQIHPGASLWLNFWENPALTGFYGENTISAFYFNDWEFIDENKNQIGEFNFVQPLVRIGAYERRLNNYWAIGGYVNDQLMKNWNIREYATSISYTKQLFKGYNFSFGAGATLRSQNLAVNQLTLREKAINSNYIFTTELGSIKSKEEYSSTYHFGGFVNHENFFIGYTAFNFGFNHFTNDNDVFLMKHCLTGGVHSPNYKKLKASALLRFEQELFTSYSPAIGLTYDNRIFTMFEYKDLSGQRISLGYQMKNGIKTQFNYSINNLENYQNTELNLDNFTERRGYISVGVNYIF